MRRLVVVAIISVVVGFGVGYLVHKPNSIVYGQPLNLKQAIQSGGLTVSPKDQ